MYSQSILILFATLLLTYTTITPTALALPSPDTSDGTSTFPKIQLQVYATAADSCSNPDGFDYNMPSNKYCVPLLEPEVGFTAYNESGAPLKNTCKLVVFSGAKCTGTKNTYPIDGGCHVLPAGETAVSAWVNGC